MLISLLMVALAVAGCGAGKPVSNTQSSQVRAPLSIPASFPSEQAKLSFATNAVVDGYYKEAQALLQEALRSIPDAQGFRYLGAAKFNNGDFQGAIAAWENSRKLDPKLAGEMENNIGNALRESGLINEAKASYRKALELEPTRWSAAVNLAHVLRTNGDLEGAIEVLENAQAMNETVTVIPELISVYQNELKAKDLQG